MTKNPIYCAIDTSCIDDADRIIREISPYIGGIKLGLEFLTSCGVKGIEKISKYMNFGFENNDAFSFGTNAKIDEFRCAFASNLINKIPGIIKKR